MGLPHETSTALIARIEAYDLDVAADPEPFSARLRRQTGWSRAYADRVLREYKRFLILTQTAGHVVSPSKAVDAVWHLHLTETRRYWEDFCPRVLGRPLHHEPSRGGPAEAARHAELYRRTLESYRSRFGAEPPRDIWPGPRPGRARVGRATWLSRAAVLAPILAVAGCAALYDSASPGAIQGPAFIVGYVALDVAALFLMAWLQSRAATARPRPKLLQSDLGAYELAYLGGGPTRVFAAALLRLIQAGHLILDPPEGKRRRSLSRTQARQAWRLGAPLPRDASAIDQAIVAAAREGRLTGPADAKPAIEGLCARLETAGLLPDAQGRGRVWRVTWLVLTPVLALGLLRLGFGISNHRAVGFLIIALIVTPLYALLMSRLRANGATVDGRRLRDAARKAKPLPKGGYGAGDDPVLGLALYGLAALAVAEFADYHRIAGAYGLATGDGGGGSDGGGDGGGGCGGGGCGG